MHNVLVQLDLPGIKAEDKLKESAIGGSKGGEGGTKQFPANSLSNKTWLGTFEQRNYKIEMWVLTFENSPALSGNICRACERARECIFSQQQADTSSPVGEVSLHMQESSNKTQVSLFVLLSDHHSDNFVSGSVMFDTSTNQVLLHLLKACCYIRIMMRFGLRQAAAAIVVQC